MHLLESLTRLWSKGRIHLMAVVTAACCAIVFAWSMSLSHAQASPNTPVASPAIAETTYIAQAEVPDPQQFRALEQDSSDLSLGRAESLMQQARQATSAQNYGTAAELLQEAFNAYNTRSNYYQEISRSFAGIENRISDALRTRARDAAQQRDEASFELAIVYRADGKADLAVGQLVQVITSQGPTRDLGSRAYNQLFELGFVETAYDAPDFSSGSDDSDS